MEKIKIEKNEKRLDLYLSESLQISRTLVQKMVSENLVFVNGKKAKSSMLLKEGDILEYELMEEAEISAEPENIPLDIVYEDPDVIVVNKANGMVVHPAIGNTHGTLVNALLYHSQELSNINGEFRPGIVHRIDADTTGLLVIAKNNKAHESLSKQLEEKTTTRKYIALVWGVIPHDTGTIDAPIGRDPGDRKKMAVVADGKQSITHFKVLERFSKVTLIELQLETGRTHQIRVHMNYIGYPVVNDPVYGKRKLLNGTGQCLHAKTLGFMHPSSNQYVEFSSELPLCFVEILNMFKDS